MIIYVILNKQDVLRIICDIHLRAVSEMWHMYRWTNKGILQIKRHTANIWNCNKNITAKYIFHFLSPKRYMIGIHLGFILVVWYTCTIYTYTLYFLWENILYSFHTNGILQVWCYSMVLNKTHSIVLKHVTVNLMAHNIHLQIITSGYNVKSK